MTFIPSPQQSAFFDFVENGQGSCVLEAVAGAGKTTTLIQALSRMNGNVLFMAFNKKIAEEISSKTAGKFPNVTVSTVHAAGLNAWKRFAGFRIQVSSDKCRDLYRQSFDHDPAMRQYESTVLSLVSFAKQIALPVFSDINDNSKWSNLIDHFSLEVGESEELVIDLARSILLKSIALDAKIVDFDDMVLAPLVHKVKAPEYDWILIDEAQDTNASRRALALLMLKRGGRLIAVGDSRQAIYGFTGADSNALDLIASAVNAIRLPLTVTYRCPKAIVTHARKWVSHIEAHESAPEGTVTIFKPTKENPITSMVKPNDVILSRFNKHLIELVYKFIAEGIPAKIEGRDIGNNLKTLARRWKVKTAPALRDKLTNYMEKETSKFRALEQESKAVAIEDRCNCLLILISRVENSKNIVTDLCAEIDNIFENNVKNGIVTLSSIHKSKGREWNRVFWLQVGPSKFARKAWEIEQEDNLNYVATTRAQKELILVDL